MAKELIQQWSKSRRSR